MNEWTEQQREGRKMEEKKPCVRVSARLHWGEKINQAMEWNQISCPNPKFMSKWEVNQVKGRIFKEKAKL